MRRASLFLALIALAAPSAAGAFLISPPIDCDLGETCHIQNYVDRDPGPGAADFTCGPLTYDGHKGTDFALPSLSEMRAGVDVIAAAPGTVLALRDGMPDIAANDPAAPDLGGRDCGNGVLIDHGGGWQTQYCHMKRGSIAVTKGQRVTKGAVLGKVGLSGRTEFPHAHLSVRQDGAILDPFAPAPGPVSCDGRTGGTPLWEDPLTYRAGGLISVGITTSIPEYDRLKEGLSTPEALPVDAPALVVWGYAFGGQSGDRVILTLNGPDGQILNHAATLDRNQAQFFRAAGKRCCGGPAQWRTGIYSGAVVLMRAGRELDRRAVDIRIGN